MKTGKGNPFAFLNQAEGDVQRKAFQISLGGLNAGIEELMMKIDRDQLRLRNLRSQRQGEIDRLRNRGNTR